jgi:hypothetical protein
LVSGEDKLDLHPVDQLNNSNTAKPQKFGDFAGSFAMILTLNTKTEQGEELLVARAEETGGHIPTVTTVL